MHHLEVPLPLAGTSVDRDDAVAEEIVPRPMAAVLVAQRHADRNVDEAQLGIGAVRRPGVVLPHAGAAELRAPLPRLRAELAWLWNEIELPPLLARMHVETADPSRQVVQAQRVVAVHRRVADDDHVIDDDRRRAVRDLPLCRIDAHGAVGPDLLHGIPLLARPSASASCRLAEA